MGLAAHAQAADDNARAQANLFIYIRCIFLQRPSYYTDAGDLAHGNTARRRRWHGFV